MLFLDIDLVGGLQIGLESSCVPASGESSCAVFADRTDSHCGDSLIHSNFIEHLWRDISQCNLIRFRQVTHKGIQGGFQVFQVRAVSHLVIVLPLSYSTVYVSRLSDADGEHCLHQDVQVEAGAQSM